MAESCWTKCVSCTQKCMLLKNIRHIYHIQENIATTFQEDRWQSLLVAVCRKLWVEEEKERIQQLQELGGVSTSSLSVNTTSQISPVAPYPVSYNLQDLHSHRPSTFIYTTNLHSLITLAGKQSQLRSLNSFLLFTHRINNKYWI